MAKANIILAGALPRVEYMWYLSFVCQTMGRYWTWWAFQDGLCGSEMEVPSGPVFVKCVDRMDRCFWVSSLWNLFLPYSTCAVTCWIYLCLSKLGSKKTHERPPEDNPRPKSWTVCFLWWLQWRCTVFWCFLDYESLTVLVHGSRSVQHAYEPVALLLVKGLVKAAAGRVGHLRVHIPGAQPLEVVEA